MKTLLAFTMFALVLSCSYGHAQGVTEEDALRFHAEYEAAVARRDAAFFERVYAEDVVYAGANGKKSTRAEIVAACREEAVDTGSRIADLRSEDVQVRILGPAAIVTGTYITTIVSTGTDPNPRVFSGRYTMIYEKRDDQWFVVGEHVSEQRKPCAKPADVPVDP